MNSPDTIKDDLIATKHNLITYTSTCSGPNILTVVIAEHGKLSHAEELSDIIVHFDEDRKPLFMEI